MPRFSSTDPAPRRTALHPLKQGQHVVVTQADAAVRGGPTEPLFLIGPVEINVTPVGINSRPAIEPALQAAQPKDTGQDAIRPAGRAPLHARQHLAGEATGGQHRTTPQAGPDARCHHMPARRCTVGTFAPAHPVARSGNSEHHPHPAAGPHPHALFGHPHLQQDRVGWHSARAGLRPAGFGILGCRFHGVRKISSTGLPRAPGRAGVQ